MWSAALKKWSLLFNFCDPESDCDCTESDIGFDGEYDGQIAYVCCRDNIIYCDPSYCTWEWWAYGGEWVKMSDCDLGCSCEAPTEPGSYDGQIKYTGCYLDLYR